jgi:cytochrome c553
MKRVIALTVVCALLGMTELAQAGDAAAGKTKAVSCSGCHGTNGVSSSPNIPSLAGQQSAYLVLQLKAYKTGNRKDVIMSGQVLGLSDNDIENLAAYFVDLKPMTAKGEPALAAAGRSKYGACQGCHGTTGAGAGINPRLAGQLPGYTLLQMAAFKSGSRKNPIMNGIAASLSENDMKALAQYVAGLK